MVLAGEEKPHVAFCAAAEIRETGCCAGLADAIRKVPWIEVSDGFACLGDKQGGGSCVLLQRSGVKLGKVVPLDGGWKAAVDVVCESEEEYNGWKAGLKDLATVCLLQAAERQRAESVSWWMVVVLS